MDISALGIIITKHFYSADLINVVNLPGWPGASFLLLRFSKSNSAGLQDSESSIKLLCIEFSGKIAAWLCSNHVLAEQDIEWAQQVASLQGLYFRFEIGHSLVSVLVQGCRPLVLCVSFADQSVTT